MFHRLFGTVKPMVLECLEVTIPAVRDAETERLIDGKVDVFIRGLLMGGNGNGGTSGHSAVKKGQMEVAFAEKRQKKSVWFYAGEVGPPIHP